MPEQSACDAGKHRTDHERHDFVSRGVHTHGLGGDFIVPYRNESTSVAGLDQVLYGHDGDQHEQVNPKEIAELRDPRETSRPSDRVDVQNKHTNDFAETESHDRQVVSA